MTRSIFLAVLLAATAAGLASCDDGSTSSPQATPSPTAPVSPATVPTLFQPPSVPTTPAENSTAAKALTAAGERTAKAGSLRMKLVAHVGTPKAARSLDVNGSGESESATRSHVLVVVTLSSRTISTESLVYDGSYFTHGEGEPWRRVTAPNAASADPRSYANFASASRGVVDAGPANRHGVPAEEYTATAVAGDGGNQPVGAAPATTPSSLPTRVTAWVDQAYGRLVGLEIQFPDIGAGPGTMSIDFTDFGAAIKLTPPSPAP